MRTKRKLGVVGALTLAVAVAVAGVAMAGTASQGTVTQSMEVAFKPTLLPKKDTRTVDPKGGAITIGVEVTDSSGQKAPPATEVDIIFDSAIYFDTKGHPICTPQEIVQLQAAQAEAKCKSAKISAAGAPVLPSSGVTNSATADCGGGASIPAVVTAFNGPPVGKNPKILLHTDADPGGGTHVIQVLEGVLINTSGPGPSRAKPKSKTLRVTVPPLAGGACSIKRFESTIKKSFKVKGEKKNYIAATCPDGTLNFDSKFTFNPDSQVNPSGVQTLAPTDEVPCKRKS